MELLIIVVLLIVNGVFSMSEAAVIASRKARLQQQADKGSHGAKAALELAEEPTRFLSTVQIGITLIGVLTGAFGGAALAHPIALLLRDTPLAPYAEAIGFGAIVLLTTYLSLIVGELVPKRLALRSPESIAARIARPMQVLSRATAPVVTLLTASTNAVLWLLRQHESEEAPVTEEEIKAMIAEGVEAGVFEEAHHDMVEGVFSLSDRRISTLMTPRTEVHWLDVQDSPEETRAKIIDSGYSQLPVCEGDFDHVIGILYAKNLLARLLSGASFDLRAAMDEPLYVPASMPASQVLEVFRKQGKYAALVVGEYGGAEGMITIQDILTEIVGEPDHEVHAIQRDDGSWLLDGLTPISDFMEQYAIDDLPGAHTAFETLGGFIMAQIGNIPKAGDNFDWKLLHLEVLDMDGNRVDKVLISVKPPETVEISAEGSTAEAG
jgi:putative hemolysin